MTYLGCDEISKRDRFGVFGMCIFVELGDTMLTLLSKETLIVQCNRVTESFVNHYLTHESWAQVG